jgi:hypothetical protein
MIFRLAAVGIILALASAAHATVLRVSAEAPLSAERLGDVLRSYLDGAEVTVSPSAGDGSTTAGSPVPIPGGLDICLRANRAGEPDAEVELTDGEETTLARLPGTIRTEDLYRAAALKVQALLQRRAANTAVA